MLDVLMRRAAPVWGLILAFYLILALSGPARTADCLSSSQASAVVRSGQVIPLGKIAAKMRGRGMDITDAKLCRRGSQYVYEVTVVTRTGSVRKVTVDARSGSGY